MLNQMILTIKEIQWAHQADHHKKQVNLIMFLQGCLEEVKEKIGKIKYKHP